MKIYNVNGFEFKNNAIRKVVVNGREFVSWYNVWLLAQVLIILSAFRVSIGLPFFYWVLAFAIVWMIGVCNRI